MHFIVFRLFGIYKLTSTDVIALAFYPAPAPALAPAPAPAPARAPYFFGRRLSSERAGKAGGESICAPSHPLSALACSEQVQDPTTTLNEPVATFAPVVQSLVAPTTKRVKFESAASVPASAQQQEEEQQSDDRKRDSPKKESKKEKSLRAKEVRREFLHRNAKSQRNVVVAQKRSSNSVALSSEVVTNAIEEVTAENAIREAAAERKRQNEGELLEIDNLMEEINMDLSFGGID